MHYFWYTVTHFTTFILPTQVIFIISEYPHYNLCHHSLFTYTLNYFFCFTSLWRILIFHTSVSFPRIWGQSNWNILTLLLYWFYFTSYLTEPLFSPHLWQNYTFHLPSNYIIILLITSHKLKKSLSVYLTCERMKNLFTHSWHHNTFLFSSHLQNHVESGNEFTCFSPH